MNRLLGGLFETLHVLATAILFAAAACLTVVTRPALLKVGAATSRETAARVFDAVSGTIGSKGVWVASLALAAGLLAPYLRGDGKKAVAWMRVLLAGGGLFTVLWMWNASPLEKSVRDADVEMNPRPADHLVKKGSKGVTPWHVLLGLSAASLALGAFQIRGGDGGGGGPKKKAG